MARVTGTEYDHIDFTRNGITTEHPLKDATARGMVGDIVKIQDQEPQLEHNKIWIKETPESEVQVPTYEEFQELENDMTGISDETNNFGASYSSGYTNMKYTFEQGMISSMGVEADSDKYIRSTRHHQVNGMLMILRVDDDHKGYIDYFNADGSFSNYIRIPNGGFLFVDRSKHAFRLVISRIDNADVTVEADQDAIAVEAYGKPSYVCPEVTEYPGYYGGSGGTRIQPQGNTYFEKYTNWIYIGDTEKLYWRLNYQNSHTSAIWIAYVIKYRDKTMTRIVPEVPASAQGFSYEITVPENAEYISFTYRTYGETVTNEIYMILDQIQKRANDQMVLESTSETKRNTERASVGFNPYRLQPFHDHLFIDNDGLGMDGIIPSESLHHIRLSRRMGFTVIEGNVHAVSGDGYVVMHGKSGTFWKEVVHADGVTDVSGIRFSDQTFSWIRDNLVYDSSVARYRTAIPSLEEWLLECKANNLIPLISIPDNNVYSIVDSIMGKANYIAYNGSRDYTSAMIVTYKSLASKAEILADCRSYGVPYMYTMANPTAFTDSELEDIVGSLHAEGYLIGIAGCYETEAEWQRVRRLGFDFSASGWRTPDIQFGNLCNLSSEPDFSAFTVSDGTVTDVLTLPVGETVTWTGAGSVFVANMALHVVFSGEIYLACGRYADEIVLTDDGTKDIFFSSYLLDGIPAFTIKAKTETTINSLTFKASAC